MSREAVGAADFIVGPNCATASTASPAAQKNDGNVGVADLYARPTCAITSTLPIDAREYVIPKSDGGVGVPDLCLASSSARTPTRPTKRDPMDGEGMVVGASELVLVSASAEASTPVQDVMRKKKMGVSWRRGVDTRFGRERVWR